MALGGAGGPLRAGAGRGSEELSVPVFSSRVTYTHEVVDSVARLGLTPSFAGRRRLKRPGPSPGMWWGEACTPAGLCRTGGGVSPRTHPCAPTPLRAPLPLFSYGQHSARSQLVFTGFVGAG